MKVKTFDRADKATILAVSACSFLFTLTVKISGMSIDKVVVLQNQLLKVLFGGSPEFLSLPLIAGLLLALVFLCLALAFLSAYGAGKDRYQTGLVCGVISAAVFLALLPSLVSLFIAASVIVVFPYTVSMSNAYHAELKKWKLFRTGSNAAGKALLLINLIIALGIFAAITADAGHYRTLFKEDLTDTITKATLGTVNIDSPLVKEQIRNRAAELVDTSPLFQSYIRWLPLLTAFSIWVALEFLRSIVLSNISGIFTAVLLRLRKK